MRLSDVFDLQRRGMMAPSSRTEFGRAIADEFDTNYRFGLDPQQAFERAEEMAEDGRLQVVFERRGEEGPFWTGDPDSGVTAVVLNFGEKTSRVEEAQQIIVARPGGSSWSLERGGTLLSRGIQRAAERKTEEIVEDPEEEESPNEEPVLQPNPPENKNPDEVDDEQTAE